MLERARDGRGGIALLVGDPGVGKTRLAEWLLAGAADLGADLATTRCAESRSAPPFWPFGQILHELGRDPAPPAGDDDRFAYYERVAGELRAGDRPVVALVDDLQWADPDSLRLLTHLAPTFATTHVLLVATMRPVDDDAPDALIECLNEIARSDAAVELRLAELPLEAVEAWLHEVDPELPGEIAEIVYQRTSGNALFVKELFELLRAEDELHDVEAVRNSRKIPAAVEFVVRRRASLLPAKCQQLLLVAAVLERADLDTLAASLRISIDEASTAIAPGLDAGLIVERGGQFVFSHALVADALAAEVNAVRHAAIHAAAAISLAERYGPDFGESAAAVAHHARQGVLAGTAELAIDAGAKAAELASSRAADEDAADQWADVADLLRRHRPNDVGAYVSARTAQARSLVHADRVFAVKAPVLDAAEHAEAAGLIVEMADALGVLNLVHVWTNQPYGVVDTQITTALERAIAHLDDDPARRALLGGALANESAFAGPTRHREVSDRAIRDARTSGRPDIIAHVLNSTMAINRADTLRERRAASAEILRARRHTRPPSGVQVRRTFPPRRVPSGSRRDGSRGPGAERGTEVAGMAPRAPDHRPGAVVRVRAGAGPEQVRLGTRTRRARS